MKKKVLLILIVFISSLTSGCWSYFGLDEITIVTGVAIDKVDDEYLLTFEVIDISNSNKQDGIKTKLISSKGKNLFDTIRNAKTEVANKLYFSNAQIIIISEQIASTEGLSSVIDFFIRDGEIRETSMVLISKAETAASLLDTEGMTDNNIISYKISEIISKAQKLNLYTLETKLYSVINTLKKEGESLVLPAFRITENEESEEEKIVELDGLATFKKDKLNNYLSLEETKYFLFAINKVEGGIFTFGSKNEKENDIAIEIFGNKTKISYTYKKETVKILIDIKMNGLLGEAQNQEEEINDKKIKELEKAASKQLKEKVLHNIKKIQGYKEYDIFGYGNKIYRSNPKLWEKLKKNWDENFSNLEIEVDCNVTIKNTAFLK